MFPEGIVVMTATLVINVLVVRYELRAGRRLNSDVLRADAMHTRSDVLTSVAVLGALLGVWWGYPLLDPIAAVLVSAFIGRAAWEIAQQASRILSDEIVIAEDDVRAVVRSMTEVLGCHQITDLRVRRPCLHGPAHLGRRADGARSRVRDVSRRERSPDDEVSAPGGRDHPHRAAAGRGGWGT